MDIEVLKDLLANKKYDVIKKTLVEMNEYDIASLISELPDDLIIQAFRLLPKSIATDVFVNMEDEVQRNLITSLTKAEAKNIIEDMFTDDAADLFEEMPAVMISSLLSNVSKETRNDINRLLRYPDNSAGSLMAVEYIRLKKGLTIRESIERIRKQKDEFVSYENFYVTDNERKLVGSVSIKDILINDPDTLIDDIMEECEHPIHTLMDQEEVATIFQDYNYSSLPVVDMEDRLVGVITIDDVVDIIEEEATEDMEKMAAIVPTEKSYDKTTVWETFKARIPWLLLLMVSATFTGKIIQGFENQLSSLTILTAFIPMLMDTGGNAGGQSSVSIIRALSLNDIEFKDIFKVVFKEFRIAILCSIVLAICNFVKLLIIDKVTVMVAGTVCLTLCLTIIIAKLIGCTLPMVAKKIGFDPAVMASPFITTIVDACSLLIYFNIATMLLGL
jgi:magnesium transporter